MNNPLSFYTLIIIQLIQYVKHYTIKNIYVILNTKNTLTDNECTLKLLSFVPCLNQGLLPLAEGLSQPLG